MLRPCFLVVDREYSGVISTRKLVIETAKFNVITAYSALEAVQTLQTFPRMNGAVIDAGTRDMLCVDLISKLKELRPDLPIIIICAPGAQDCPGADHILESFEPAKLLNLLKNIVPAETAEIEKQNELLSKIER
jgi:DNA-binding NtrC family response regulator